VVVVESGEMRRRLPQLNEQALMTAIMQLSRGADKKIVFANGHGEKDTLDTNPSGFNKVRRNLQLAGYQVIQAELTDEAIKDAAAVIIAGPQVDFDTELNARLQKYLEAGGGLMVMVDPHPGVSLVELLKPYRIEPQDNFIVELNKAFRHPSYGPTTSYIRAFHMKQPVGARMNQPILLNFVRSIAILKDAQSAAEGDDTDSSDSPMGMCVSSPNSWGESEKNLEKKISWDREVDQPGPLVMAAGTSEPPSLAGQGRLMVIGTSGFADNRHLDLAGNREFFETTVSWLAQDLNSPMLETTEPQRKLDLSDAQLRQMLVVTSRSLLTSRATRR